MKFSRKWKLFNGMNEIEQCDLVFWVGIILTKSERELSLMTVRNDITNSSLPFMNGVSMRFSKTILPHYSHFSSSSVLSCTVHLLSNKNIVHACLLPLWPISPTFYEQLLHQNPFTKNLQTQIVSMLKLRKKLFYKKADPKILLKLTPGQNGRAHLCVVLT